MLAAMSQVSLYPAADRRLPEQYHPANVLRLAENLPGGLRAPEFIELVSRIDTGPLHVANKVELFFNGQAAFASIHEAINAARNEVLTGDIHSSRRLHRPRNARSVEPRVGARSHRACFGGWFRLIEHKSHVLE